MIYFSLKIWMMKTFFLVLISLIYSSIVFAQQTANAGLIVYTHLPDDTSDVFVTGNNSLIGNWDPHFHRLEKINDSTWQTIINLPVNTELEFKFTLGDWNREALNNDKTIPGNHSLKIISDTTLKYFISNWKDESEKITFGQITGNVKYHHLVSRFEILPRDIIVWLPPGYETEVEKRYPVLYMQDGQNIIDPATSTFGVDWQLDENADTLIRQGLIDPVIIVGIYNTRFRSSEYGINDTSVAYKNFVVNELKPFIDSNYRTKQEGEFNAVAGSSLGALIAFELVWEYPDIFSKCACVSPAFDIDRYNYIPFVQHSDSQRKPIKIYIDNGGLGIDSLLQHGVDEMNSILKNKGYKKGINLYYKFYPEAYHSEKDWSARVWQILIYLFGTEKGKKLL